MIKKIILLTLLLCNLKVIGDNKVKKFNSKAQEIYYYLKKYEIEEPHKWIQVHRIEVGYYAQFAKYHNYFEMNYPGGRINSAIGKYWNPIDGYKAKYSCVEASVIDLKYRILVMPYIKFKRANWMGDIKEYNEDTYDYIVRTRWNTLPTYVETIKKIQYIDAVTN